MANKLKKLPNFLNKSPWLWRSCTQSRTLSFRHPNDIFRTINLTYYDDEDEDEEPPRVDMSNNDDDNEDQIEALVRGLRLRQGNKRLFLELDETNSIMTAATVAVTTRTVAGNCQVPFKESVAMAMESKDPYLDFKKSMEEMVEAHGLKDWKGMERLLSWYLKANGKQNHELIIGAFVDLLVDLAFASSSSSFTNNNSPSPSSSSSSSSLLCSSCSSTSPNSSSCSCSSFRAPLSIISSSSVEIMKDIVESNCSSSSSLIHDVSPPCLSSLYEDEEGDVEEGF
ncbi:transcription repressor OFP15-like [Benincasa hispida]|uniref:transcription repressor OFP15-like n=1 Tax=Benincasa hispida TaxID=102211 RepID=UPI001901F9A3|nr:transcription repressor OFP15-like [Benincasa hispida]